MPERKQKQKHRNDAVPPPDDLFKEMDIHRNDELDKLVDEVSNEDEIEEYVDKRREKSGQ